MSFPETVSDSLCRNYFGCANLQFHQLCGWLVSDDSAGEKARCRGPGMAWLRWSVIVRQVGRTAKFSKMVEKLTLNSLATALVDVPAVSTPNICGIVLCDKTAHFKVAFYCPWHNVHLCNDHAV
jgi:hypothetical protein